MTQLPLYRHSGFQPEQPWFVLNAAQPYSLIASDNPAISHFYGSDVSQSDSMTLAITDGSVDPVFDRAAHCPAARVCGTTLDARGAGMHQNQIGTTSCCERA